MVIHSMETAIIQVLQVGCYFCVTDRGAMLLNWEDGISDDTFVYGALEGRFN